MNKIKTAVNILKESETDISQWIEDNKDKSKFSDPTLISPNQKCVLYYKTGEITKSIADNFCSLNGLFREIEEFLYKRGVSSKEVIERFDKVKQLNVDVSACRGDVLTMSIQPRLLFLMPTLRDAIQELIRYLDISSEKAEDKTKDPQEAAKPKNEKQEQPIKLTAFIEQYCFDPVATDHKPVSVPSKANRIHAFVKSGKIKFMPKPIGEYKNNETKLYKVKGLIKVWPKLKLKIKSLPDLKP